MTITYTCTLDDYRQATVAVQAGLRLHRKRSPKTRIIGWILGFFFAGWMLFAFRQTKKHNPLGFHLLVPAVVLIVLGGFITTMAVWKTSGIVRRVLLLLYIPFFLAAMIWLPWDFLLATPGQNVWTLFEPHVGWLGLLVMFTVLAFFFRNRLKTTWDLQKYLHEPHTLDASPERLVISTGLSQSEYRWLKFTDLLETRDVFVLMFSPLSFQMIPKRAFADARQLDEFRSLAQVIKTRQSPGFAVIPMARIAPNEAQSVVQPPKSSESV